MERFVSHPGGRNDGDVLALARLDGLADRNWLECFGYWASGAVERTMLEYDHWTVVLEGRDGEALRIAREGRHDHRQPGEMRQRRLQALRVRGALSPALTDDRAHDDRHVARPAHEHVAPLRSQVDQVVEA